MNTPQVKQLVDRAITLHKQAIARMVRDTKNPLAYSVAKYRPALEKLAKE